MGTGLLQYFVSEKAPGDHKEIIKITQHFIKTVCGGQVTFKKRFQHQDIMKQQFVIAQ